MRGFPWVVVPTYDEADNIEPLLGSLSAALEDAAPAGHGILVVDDSSPDGTGEIAERVARVLPAVEVLHRPVKQGLGPAYVAGFRHALHHGATHVVEMDADFSHDPADLATLLAAADGGADVVLGSRYVPGGRVEDWGRARRLVSRAGCAYARRVLGLRIRDLTGGFKCLHREVLETVDLGSLASRGYAFQVELTWRAVCAGFEVVEVPITFRDRRGGRSKMSTAIALEAAWRVPMLRARPAPPPAPATSRAAASAG
jgi:dolichol-phosphate mannosyltransferase